MTYTQIKIKQSYRQKLEQLAMQHNRSMANMVEVLIDQELKLPPSQKPTEKP